MTLAPSPSPLLTAPVPNKKCDVIIVGAGLAGIAAAILLSQGGKKVLLMEKKNFPFHKVCGEYVSNEVLPFLKSIGFNPFEYGASAINKLRVSTPSGKNIYAPLDLGGFGLSRYIMDNALLQLAQQIGVQTLTNTRVLAVAFHENNFSVETSAGESFSAPIVMGSYGKRDLLDKKLNRSFIRAHTGYMGVKYHIRTDYPVDEVGLDNFEGGYCGIAKIEEDKYNLCYLYKRSEKVNFHHISELEEKVLFKNPTLRNIFSHAEFIFDEPEVINEISFAPKKLIEQHVLMCGDSAGLITPLCGNGMAMAITGARMLSELILRYFSSGSAFSPHNRTQLENDYQQEWNRMFRSRLHWGRRLQQLFGSPVLTGIGIQCIHAVPPLEKWLIRKTHGTTFS